MADRETWAKRVAEWRTSGLSSPAFCEGKEFTAGGLRYWATRLRSRQEAPGQLRVARVVRLSQLRAAPQQDGSPAGATPDVMVEIGAARIALRPGFDRATFAAVVEVLAAAGRAP